MARDLHFHFVTDDRGLELLRDAWDGLDDGAHPGAIFRSWEWQASWWRTLGQAPRRRLRVLVGRDDRGPRGILPMYVEDAPVAGVVPRRRLRFLADDTVGSDYLGLVAPAADQAELAPLFARRVAADPDLRDADLADLHDLLDGDPLGDALAVTFRAGGWDDVRTRPRYVCPFAAFTPDLDGYLGARPDHFGRQIEKRRQELGRKHGFSLATHDSPEAIVRGLDALFALHRTRWEDDGGSQAIPTPAVEAFHRHAGRLLAERGRARMGILTLGGEPAAAAYGFQRGRTFAYYQAGMLPEWRRRSAGMVVMVELMRRAAAEGAVEFDFLRGEETYKRIWATGARTTHSLHAGRPTLRARLSARAEDRLAALKRAARARLPAPALDVAQRLWRRIGSPA